MSGLGEKAVLAENGESKAADSFWSWRTVMYRYLERIQPHHLYAIARMLYLEMLQAGYTAVGEFQYLHHDPDGNAYADPAEMTMQCLQAATDVGIGFTALPVLYRYGGFGSREPLEGQKRFLNDSETFCEIVQGLQRNCAGDQNCSVGIAPHSLRAIDEPLLKEVLNNLAETNLAANHIHVAEQIREVEDCVAWSGQRPVEWLLDHFEIDPNWCLVHATHMDEAETVRLAKSGAIAGLCPTTEANLGDGFFNLADYVENNGSWAIGSDSHISMSPVEELRWLEYGQRLLLRQRNFMANPDTLSTGMSLFGSALSGGSRACGRSIDGIRVGNRADFIVLDSNHPRLTGRKADDLMDSWIFSGNANPVSDVYIGGRKCIDNGCHRDQDEIKYQFMQTLKELSE
jgi:formimidoylglutamate deiminase